MVFLFYTVLIQHILHYTNARFTKTTVYLLEDAPLRLVEGEAACDEAEASLDPLAP